MWERDEMKIILYVCSEEVCSEKTYKKTTGFNHSINVMEDLPNFGLKTQEKDFQIYISVCFILQYIFQAAF